MTVGRRRRSRPADARNPCVYTGAGPSHVSRIRTLDAIAMISLSRISARLGPRRCLPHRRRRSSRWRCQPIAAAQGSELVGARARGMGGAFVAVADDATRDLVESGRPARDAHLRWRRRRGAASTRCRIGRLKTRAAPGRTARSPSPRRCPVAGFQLHTTCISGGSSRCLQQGRPAGRQEGGRAPDRTVAPDTALRRLLRPVAGRRGRRGRDDAARRTARSRRPMRPADDVDDAFDRAADAEGASATRGDIDAGVLVRLSRVRVGLAARNLAEPSFDGRRRRQLDARASRAGLGVAVVGDGRSRRASCVGGRRRRGPHDRRPGRRSAGAASAPASSAGSRAAGSACAAASRRARPARRGRRPPAG